MTERTPNTLARRPIDRTDPDDRRRYIAGLETAFGTWGDDDRFAWAFDRSCGAGPADLAVLVDTEGRWLAGSAVTHRLVRAPSGELEAAGIMSSSWTVPAARGRGCLTNFIEWSREVVRARGSDLLLAFMTDTNASQRRLAAAGADLVPTWYALWDAPNSGEERKFPSPSGDHLARLAERALTPVSDAHTITYPDAGAWAGQFLRRPDPVDVVTVPGGCAVMERAVGTDRLLAAIADRAAEPLEPAAVLATLVASAARRGCKMFGFMIDPAWAEAARTLGAAVQTGRLTRLSDRHASPRRGGSRAGTGCEGHGHGGQPAETSSSASLHHHSVRD